LITKRTNLSGKPIFIAVTKKKTRSLAARTEKNKTISISIARKMNYFAAGMNKYSIGYV
jgi:hypothetical protein